jgi:hypothetical protein
MPVLLLRRRMCALALGHVFVYTTIEHSFSNTTGSACVNVTFYDARVSSFSTVGGSIGALGAATLARSLPRMRALEVLE